MSVPGYAHGVKWHQMTEQEVQALVDEHGTIKAVARHLGVNHAAVHRAIKDYGWHITSDKSRWKKRTSRLVVHHDRIRELALTGQYSTTEIARLIGEKNAEQVRRYMVRHNMPRIAEGARKGAKNHGWRGGRIIDADGYVQVHQPDHPNAKSNGKVYEHRLVMEQVLGRYLEPEEVVHHINGIKDDNRPENLALFAK